MHGRPVAYAYLSGRFPLRDFQTVFADEPGSAEMASAGRPFTAELVVRLAVRGVAVAPVVLHAGVSSPELHEPPLPERFAVPAVDRGASHRHPGCGRTRRGRGHDGDAGARERRRARRHRARRERAGPTWCSAPTARPAS